jgi:hypothetical protein
MGGDSFRQIFRGLGPAPKREEWYHLQGNRTLQFLFDVLWSALIDVFAK